MQQIQQARRTQRFGRFDSGHIVRARQRAAHGHPSVETFVIIARAEAPFKKRIFVLQHAGGGQAVLQSQRIYKRF